MAYPLSLRTALMASSAAVVVYAGPALAQSRAFDLPAQPAASGIAAFAEQADIQILVMEQDTRGRKTQSVRGTMTTAEGLQQLLDGSGLWVIADDGRTVTLSAQDPQSQGAAGAGAEVEALIVTAQKREEDIQDVPIAISAFTQEDLTRSQVAGGPDLITQVPNMTFTKTNFSSYSIQLRGIGTQAISATTDPAVAVAFNNTPFIRNRFFEQEFYDLQRVEVLRGPQGTLYGRNATAGVVNIISQKPRFNFEAKASADVSNFSSHRLEGMINIPLVEDTVALRLAGAWTKRDGYAVNQLSGDPIDGRDLWSTRLSLRVTPNDRIDANLIWEHFEENDDRLRSGKQLCKKDVVLEVAGFEQTKYLQTLPNTGQNGLISGTQATFSQGCGRNSLYVKNSYQRPNGLMLPYYVPLGAIGLPTALVDPYVLDYDPQDPPTPEMVSARNDQPEDLRVIESVIDPTYRAWSDLGELQISIDLTDTLSLSSETAYAFDTVYSLQDFNRFNTAAGAWGGGSANISTLISRGILRDDLGENLQFCDPQLGCSDRLMAVDISTATATQFSQELRLGSNYEGSFNFNLGANYLRGDSNDKYYVFINSLSLIAASGGTAAFLAGDMPYIPNVTDNSDCLENGYAPGDPNGVYPVVGCVYLDPNPIGSVNDQGHNYFLSTNPYKLISYAVFGEAYYNISDTLKITAGLRYTIDKKDAPRVPSWILGTNTVGYPVAEVLEQEWREPTGRLALDWKPDFTFTDETLIYASYAHGYKAGGANPPGYVRVHYGDVEGATASTAQSATRPRVFDAEFIDAFEIGAKNTLLDGAATVNLAAFYYDYKDYQISEIVDRSAFNRNLDATVWGIELESDWRPFENLRIGVKGGYENTRIADHEQAIDLMDRTAGDPRWTLSRPFPTYASSCILPTWLFVGSSEDPNTPRLVNLGGVAGGGPSGCEYVYQLGVDPVSRTGFVVNPPQPAGVFAFTHSGPIDYAAWSPNIEDYAAWPTGVPLGNTYPGVDPKVIAALSNNGEGIMKPLGGNALPNAPNWTATITADYSIPLPNDWLATVHTDLHWQSESFWRVFQDHEFSTLDEYFTMNLAAIFVNEERGWNIMAYIKNVTDETAITGAFLNSDDTGLTTNVFLTEPRLYGMRVTKAWTGGPILGGFGGAAAGPKPFTLEVGGQVQRHDAANEPLLPSFSDNFEGRLAISDDTQRQDLDWGAGGDLKLTWRPGGAGPWALSAAMRRDETNGTARNADQFSTPTVCAFANPEECESVITFVPHLVEFSRLNRADAFAHTNEEHQIVDLKVEHDLPLADLVRSSVAFGVRKADLQTKTVTNLKGIPDWNAPPAFYYTGLTHTLYDIDATAVREFSGFGPVVSWDAGLPLLAVGDGAVDFDWSISAGVLFGEQEVEISEAQKARKHEMIGFDLISGTLDYPDETIVLPVVRRSRSDDATVPSAGLSLGLSYGLGGFRVGAGYRWERYFDAIDGGYTKHRAEDRTIDGPYFKIAVGFGG